MWHAAVGMQHSSTTSAVDLQHQSRIMRRMAHSLHMLWDSYHDLEPERIVDKLRLKESLVECTESEADEALVDAVANVLLQRYKIIVKQRAEALRRRRGIDVSRAVDIRRWTSKIVVFLDLPDIFQR